MSIRIMSDVWAFGPEHQGELMVLLVLADYANDEGECWPAVGSIAEKARISERSVRRILRNLEESGYIQTHENRGRNYTNLYQINLESLKPDNLAGVENDTKNRTSDAENRTSATVKPDTVSPEPSRTTIEPPKGRACSFSDFWEVWPNRNAKDRALKAWKKLSPSQRQLATDGAKDWYAAWRKQHPTASDMLPASFLNGKRWEDEGWQKSGNVDQAKRAAMIEEMKQSPVPAIREQARRMEAAQ